MNVAGNPAEGVAPDVADKVDILNLCIKYYCYVVQARFHLMMSFLLSNKIVNNHDLRDVVDVDEDGGIVVDDYLRTSDHDIFAGGLRYGKPTEY